MKTIYPEENDYCENHLTAKNYYITKFLKRINFKMY